MSTSLGKLVEEAEAREWYVPICARGAEDPFFADSILDKSRAGWVFHCLKESGNRVCADLGSGLGTVAFALAEHFEHVWSVEPGWEEIRFQRARKGTEGKANVHLVCSSLLRLPIASGSVDLAVISGALERLQVADASRRASLQREFVREAHRILRPGGCLYVGIENRLGLRFGLGARDRSARLRSSPADCRRLFRESGFDRVESYWAWRDYRFPRVSGTFDGAALKYFLKAIRPRAAFWRNRLVAAVAQALPAPLLSWAARALWPHFLVFAYKAGPSPSERLQSIVRRQSADSTGVIRIGTPRAHSPKQTYLLVRGPFVEKAVSVVATAQFSGAVDSHSVPRFVRPAGKFRLSVAEGVKGFPLDPTRPDHTELAMAWLLEFQATRKRGVWLQFELRREIEEILALVAAQPDAGPLKSLAAELAHAYLALAGGVGFYGTSEHGDFQYRNILLDGGGRPVLIDWDDFRPRGNPLLDIGTYLWALADGRVAEFALMLRGRGPLGRSFEVALGRYGAGSGLPGELVAHSIPYAILRLLKRDALPVSSDGDQRVIRPSIIQESRRYLEAFRDAFSRRG